jgi:hypothetical protein
MEKAE